MADFQSSKQSPKFVPLQFADIVIKLSAVNYMFFFYFRWLNAVIPFMILFIEYTNITSDGQYIVESSHNVFHFISLKSDMYSPIFAHINSREMTSWEFCISSQPRLLNR